MPGNQNKVSVEVERETCGIRLGTIQVSVVWGLGFWRVQIGQWLL